MSYVQTQTDKEDEKLLRKLLTKKVSKKESDDIIKRVFSNLIKWTFEDVCVHLTQVFSFTDQECRKLIHDYDLLATTTEDSIMTPIPNFNATAPRDVQDFSQNLWLAKKSLSDVTRYLSATANALTSDDFDNEEDFQESIVQRCFVAEKIIDINKYIDELRDFAEPYMPPKK